MNLSETLRNFWEGVTSCSGGPATDSSFKLSDVMFFCDSVSQQILSCNYGMQMFMSNSAVSESDNKEGHKKIRNFSTWYMVSGDVIQQREVAERRQIASDRR